MSESIQRASQLRSKFTNNIQREPSCRLSEAIIVTNLQIQKSGLLDRLRVPRLNALVMAPEEGGASYIHGMLFDAVLEPTMVWQRQHAAPLVLRKRWYDDVVEMTGLLHENDIVWGDFKPDNMLLDEKDDIWLVDFGGGVTEGWLDDENLETIQGDLQGLERFKEFLKLY